jgi:F420-dependent oxidoreductase-like protein
MRFGLFIPQGWRHDLVGIDPAEHWGVMNSLAQHADAGPWDSLWVYDHFHTVPVPSDQATHEAWTLMAAFAASTNRIKLGQMCTCMAYRNPAYLAKVAATVDIISGGRLQMGIGAGWYEHEWRAYGYGFPSPGDRLGMLREGIEIMRQAWDTGEATLDGKHYQVHRARVYPKPLQDGGPPLWVAGGGEKVTLRIAAQHAAFTNFDGRVKPFVAKSDILREHCREVGTDFDAIVRSANYNTIIASSEAEVVERVAALRDRMTRSVGEEAAERFMLEYQVGKTICVGTPEQVVERLRELKELGMTYSIHYFPEAAYDRSSTELFEREVMPQLA